MCDIRKGDENGVPLETADVRLYRMRREIPGRSIRRRNVRAALPQMDFKVHAQASTTAHV
jgi:hypothetical protein